MTLWTSSLGVTALIRALNAAYDTGARRSYLQRAGLALLLTLCAIAIAIAVAIVAIAAVVVAPLPAGEDSRPTGLIQVLRWPVIAAVFWLGAAVIYRYGPSLPERPPRGAG